MPAQGGAQQAVRDGAIGLGIAGALTLGTHAQQVRILADIAAGTWRDADDIRARLVEESPSVAHGCRRGPLRRHRNSQERLSLNGPAFRGWRRRAARADVRSACQCRMEGEKCIEAHGFSDTMVGLMAPNEALVRALIAKANSALAAHNSGDLISAERLYREVMPQMEHPAVLTNFGALLVQTKRPAEALPILQRAVVIARDKASATLNLAAACRDLGQLDAASSWLQRVISHSPDNPEALGNLGVVLTSLQRFNDAARLFMRARGIHPYNCDSIFNLGVLRREQADLAAAVICYRQVLSLAPDHLGALDNLATALGDLGRTEEACAIYVRLLTLQQNRHDVRFWYGNMLIAAGHWSEGWSEYEARRRYLPSTAPPLGLQAPDWDGTPLPSGTLLLYGEQGVGDVLLMVRFLPHALERLGKVVLAVQAPLVRLLSNSVPKNTTVISLGANPGPIDAVLPIMSLVAVLGLACDDIGGDPYLVVDDHLRRNWRSRLPVGAKPRVGLVWAGNPNYLHDRFRSPGFAAVRPLLELPQVNWVILQVGQGREQLAHFPRPSNVFDLGGEVRDFADTAAILSELDLLISSDTAPAHLAGALGVPCRVMAPALLDWRWSQDEEGQSRWYHSVRVTRQPALGNWAAVVEDLINYMSK